MTEEKSYREALIKALRPFGKVLVVGFSDAVEYIQSYKPKSITIVEPDPVRFAEATIFAENYDNMTLINEPWKNVLPGLDSFDTIFYDDFPPSYEENEAQTLLGEAKELLDKAEETMATIKVSYSDQDIAHFYETVGQQNKEALPNFFKTLRKNGFISERQYSDAVKNYQIVEEAQLFEPLLTFLRAATERMSSGSRFSGFSLTSTSKYEDPAFFDHIITNPRFAYEESVMSGNKPHLIMIVNVK